MVRGALLGMLLVTCAGCDSQPRAPAANDQASNGSAAESANRPSNVTQGGEPGALPDDRTPLAEGPIDPQSAEGAGQVVQHFGALIEQSRRSDAAQLWTDPAGSNALMADLAAPEIHLEIGRPGPMEGAAGSVYVTVPVVFYGMMVAGQPFRRPANVILRRVNEVPGSTEAQRRWHIERIDMQPPL